MKVGKFLVAFVFSLIFMAENCFAEIYPKEELEKLKDTNPELYAQIVEYIKNGSKDSLWQDMQINPKNYVESGTYWGFNNEFVATQYYILKPSLEVKQYAPPKYIISIKRIAYTPIQDYYSEEMKKYGIPAREYGIYEFLYNYDEQKIYMKNIDSNNQPYWEYLDPKFANVRNEQHTYDLEAAELAFYFAYNQSFFKKPLSKNFKKHIEKGDFKTFKDYKKLKTL